MRIAPNAKSQRVLVLAVCLVVVNSVCRAYPFKAYPLLFVNNKVPVRHACRILACTETACIKLIFIQFVCSMK